MKLARGCLCGVLAGFWLLAMPEIPAASASDTATAATAPALGRPQTQTEKKAIDYLVSQQAPDGSWFAAPGPAVTAMVVKALIQAGKPITDPAVAKGLDYIDKFRKDDGSYYSQGYITYNTALVLSTMGVIPGDRYKAQIPKTQNFLRGILYTEGKTDLKGNEITKDNPWYGGAGYAVKGGTRPDLSNTEFVMEAFHDTGITGADPDMQRMLTYVSRCQANSETNSLAWAKGRTDGGFVYTLPEDGGVASSGDTTERSANDKMKEYGSITYAGFKSYLYADLSKDDPRVTAVRNWVAGNWTLEENPGLGTQDGLYNYYHMFAKALAANGQDTITDTRGVKHDWRAEFEAAAKQHQRDDGSFANTRARWMETNPILSTVYVVLGLQETRK